MTACNPRLDSINAHFPALVCTMITAPMPISITRRSACKLLVTFSGFRAEQSPGQMYLALNSTVVNNRVPWPDFARLAAKTGFPGTDVILGPAQQRGASATNDLLAHLNLKPAVLEFPVDFRKDEATFAAGLRDLPN